MGTTIFWKKTTTVPTIRQYVPQRVLSLFKERATDALRVSFTLESNQTSMASLTRVLCSVSTLFDTVTDKLKVGTFSYNGEILEIKQPKQRRRWNRHYKVNYIFFLGEVVLVASFNYLLTMAHSVVKANRRVTASIFPSMSLSPHPLYFVLIIQFNSSTCQQFHCSRVRPMFCTFYPFL